MRHLEIRHFLYLKIRRLGIFRESLQLLPMRRLCRLRLHILYPGPVGLKLKKKFFLSNFGENCPKFFWKTATQLSATVVPLASFFTRLKKKNRQGCACQDCASEIWFLPFAWFEHRTFWFETQRFNHLATGNGCHSWNNANPLFSGG